MNKVEFLHKLEAALSGELNKNIIMENLRFYDEYIDTEMKKGKTEEDIVSELGDPRLIAKTILETSEKSDVHKNEEQYSNINEESSGPKKIFYTRNYNYPWIPILIVFLVLFIVLAAIGSFIAFIAPIAIPAAIILFIYWLFKRK